MIIIERTIGHIKMQKDDKVVTISGEGCIPKNAHPYFVAYQNSIQNWDPPHDKEPVSEIDKKEVIATLKEEKNMIIETE